MVENSFKRLSYLSIKVTKKPWKLFVSLGRNIADPHTHTRPAYQGQKEEIGWRGQKRKLDKVQFSQFEILDLNLLNWIFLPPPIELMVAKTGK